MQKTKSMRIICDAPGQTCNRLWTYVASVAQCIAEKKKMSRLPVTVVVSVSVDDLHEVAARPVYDAIAVSAKKPPILLRASLLEICFFS